VRPHAGDLRDRIAQAVLLTERMRRESGGISCETTEEHGHVRKVRRQFSIPY
jgi:hypothetical protein